MPKPIPRNSRAPEKTVLKMGRGFTGYIHSMLPMDMDWGPRNRSMDGWWPDGLDAEHAFAARDSDIRRWRRREYSRMEIELIRSGLATVDEDGHIVYVPAVPLRLITAEEISDAETDSSQFT